MVFKHKDKNESIDSLVNALDKLYEHFKPENQAKLMYHEFDVHMNAYKSVLDNLKLSEDGKLKEENVDSILEDYLLNFLSSAHGERGNQIASELKKLFEEQRLSNDERFEHLSKILPNLVGISAEAIRQARTQLKNRVKYSKYRGEDFKKEFGYHLHKTFHDLIESEHPLVQAHNSKMFNDYVLSVPDYYHPGVIAEALKKKGPEWNLYVKESNKARTLLPVDLYQIMPTIAQGSNLPDYLQDKYGLAHKKYEAKMPENKDNKI